MDSYPSEVLVNIFKHMHQRDLLSLSLVCKRFDEIINHYQLIRRIYLKSSNDDSLMTLRRNYSEVAVKDLQYYMKSFPPNQLQAFSNFTKLSFDNCEIKLSHLQEIMSRTNSVKFMHFSYVRVCEEKWEEAKVWNVLSQLNDVELIFEESDPSLFKIIKNFSFKSIKMRNYGDSSYTQLNDFVLTLKTQEHLETLKIGGIFESNLFMVPVGKSNFQLKHFEIDNSDLEEYENVESFLAEHSETIETFSVSDIHRWDPSAAIVKFKKLKSLEISNDMKVDYLTEMPSVEILIWNRSNPSNAIRNFPYLRKLKIDLLGEERADDTITIITQTMNKLEELELMYCPVEQLNLPELKKLRLDACTGITPRFFEQHTKIEDLTLRFYELNDEILTSVVRNCKNLKVLTITDNNHLSGNSYQIIGENCKNLKIFNAKHWVQMHKNDEWKNLLQINGLQIFIKPY